VGISSGWKNIVIKARSRLMVNNVGAMCAQYLAAHGIAQILSPGAEQWLTSGKLVDLFPDWPDERFPLWALAPSRHHPPAKARAFIDFVVQLTGSPVRDTASSASRIPEAGTSADALSTLATGSPRALSIRVLQRGGICGHGALCGQL
jgi:hypothetical protein